MKMLHYHNLWNTAKASIKKEIQSLKGCQLKNKERQEVFNLGCYKYYRTIIKKQKEKKTNEK